MRTGAAITPAPASPPSLSFSNHWICHRMQSFVMILQTFSQKHSITIRNAIASHHIAYNLFVMILQTFSQKIASPCATPSRHIACNLFVVILQTFSQKDSIIIIRNAKVTPSHQHMQRHRMASHRMQSFCDDLVKIVLSKRRFWKDEQKMKRKRVRRRSMWWKWKRGGCGSGRRQVRSSTRLGFRGPFEGRDYSIWAASH